MDRLILAINPGSTSTKISLYNNEKEVFTKTLRHTNEELAPYQDVISQRHFRKEVIMKALADNNVELSKLAIVVGRGGIVKPVESGVYAVSEEMIKDVESKKYGEHASSLGCVLAKEIAEEIGGNIPAVMVDPPVVDELEPIARVSGQKLLEKVSVFHALNQKAIAKRYAKEQGKFYKDMNLIVAHLGGGVSVSIHSKGRVIDTNDALHGEGPFSPERAGGVPALSLIDLCFSGKYTKEEVSKLINGKGGFVSYLGTNSFLEIKQRIAAGDKEAALYADAFVYQIAQYIGSMATVVSGDVDAILVTGGIAYSEEYMQKLAERVKFIAPVHIYPGEDEMGALATAALALLNGEEEMKKY